MDLWLIILFTTDCNGERNLNNNKKFKYLKEKKTQLLFSGIQLSILFDLMDMLYTYSTIIISQNPRVTPGPIALQPMHNALKCILPRLPD